ncbi:hypothetical protein NDA01_23375 [Trichocoleus desertorum AS-A10]|uniref:hypothetical protein n=1 Tax=Trichocoleus desertorum TaxID=1481672 RepID=UPI0032989C78
MENPSNSIQWSTIKLAWLSLPIFMTRILKAGFFLLVFGAVFIVLIKFNVVTDHVIPQGPDPLSLAGGAIVLVALTLIGVPLIPAAAAGVAAWWLFQSFR